MRLMQTRLPARAWRGLSNKKGHEPDSLSSSFESVKNMALKIISRSTSSRHEVEKKLVDKGCTKQEALSALDYLVDIGLHSDAVVAEVVVRSRWNQQRKSLAVIKRELVQVRKIDKTVADRALEDFFGSRDMQARDIRDAGRSEAANCYDEEEEEEEGEEEEEEEDRQVVLGGELLATVRRKAEMMQGDPESKRRKISGWLMRRGHRWEVIGPILDDLFVTRDHD